MSSLITPFGRAISSATLQNLIDKQNNQQQSGIDRLVEIQTRQLNRQPQPFTFIQSNNNALSSNVSDGTMIIQSPVMNHGEQGVVEDLNINFTTVAGTVRIVKIRGYNSSNILVDVTRTITSSASGTGSVVLEEGEAIAIVGQVAGAGTFGAFFSGHKVTKGV